MQQFTDCLDRKWSIEIDFYSVKRLRRELQIDLLSVCEEHSTLLRDLARDEVLLIDVISCLLTDQIKARDMDEREFAKGLLGDGLQRAVDALVKGIADFSLPQKGALIRMMWDKIKSLESQGIEQVTEVLESSRLDNLLRSEIESRLATFTPSSIASPESLASNRGGIPSATSP